MLSGNDEETDEYTNDRVYWIYESQFLSGESIPVENHIQRPLMAKIVRFQRQQALARCHLRRLRFGTQQQTS